MLVASVLAAIRQAVAAAHADPATNPPTTSSNGLQSATAYTADSCCNHSRQAQVKAVVKQDLPTDQIAEKIPADESSGSFPGSFLGLEAPATVARVRDAIGGPSIAMMLRRAAGLGIPRMNSGNDWELL